MHLKFFSQQPDNAYVSLSKGPLQFTNFAALMQVNVESTEVQGCQVLMDQKCQIARQNMPIKPKHADGCRF